MARVELEGVSKQFPGGVTAVKSIDLVATDGEFVVLVGPSGSGKTTVLRLVAGLERPTAGQIRIGEREVSKLPPRVRDVAYVPQSCPLYPHLSVYDNLAFGRRVRNGSIVARCWQRIVPSAQNASGRETAAETSARIRTAASRLGIGHLLERWPRQLSGGERQRVALGRALVRDPAVFLFDEPLSSLDANLRSQLRTELKQLQRQVGRATLYVTHDQAEAMALADKVVVLNHGQVQQIASPEEIYDRPANRFVAQFIGAPPMNLLPGKIQQRDDDWYFTGDHWQLKIDQPLTTALATDGREVELGLRPEAIELLAASTPHNAASALVISSVRQSDTRELTLACPTSSAPSGRLVTKVPATTNYREQTLASWRPRWSQAHWFDRRTGQRIE